VKKQLSKQLKEVERLTSQEENHRTLIVVPYRRHVQEIINEFTFLKPRLKEYSKTTIKLENKSVINVKTIGPALRGRRPGKTIVTFKPVKEKHKTTLAPFKERSEYVEIPNYDSPDNPHNHPLPPENPGRNTVTPGTRPSQGNPFSNNVQIRQNNHRTEFRSRI